MRGRSYSDLPLQAVLVAVWRPTPKAKVDEHSDPGSQFASHGWQEVIDQRKLSPIAFEQQ